MKPVISFTRKKKKQKGVELVVPVNGVASRHMLRVIHMSKSDFDACLGTWNLLSLIYFHKKINKIYFSSDKDINLKYLSINLNIMLSFGMRNSHMCY